MRERTRARRFPRLLEYRDDIPRQQFAGLYEVVQLIQPSNLVRADALKESVRPKLVGMIQTACGGHLRQTVHRIMVEVLNSGRLVLNDQRAL